MRALAAYLLLTLAGAKPTADSISKLLGAVDIEVQAADVEKVIAELSGKDLEEVIKKGKEQLAAVPTVAAAAPAPAAAAPAAKGDSKPAKEEKKEEPVEEEEGDMGFGLFD